MTNKFEKMFRVPFLAFLIVSMVFSQVALPISVVYATQEKLNICHKTEIGWQFMDTPAGPSLDGHLSHGDFLFNPSWGEATDQNCIDHAPVPPAQTATISATKVVCDAEQYLPNWGSSDETKTITATTAADFVASSAGKCRIAPWTFEWGTVDNPGDNVSVGGSGWTSFTTTATIPAGLLVWVREQTQLGYTPFSGATTDLDTPTSKNSAEVYCDSDVYNYDNYDHTVGTDANTTHHCVAFNAIVPAPLQCNPQVNLIQNGDFEAPALSASTWDIIPSSNTLLKWFVSFINPLSLGRLGLEIQNNVAGNPASGVQHAELDGDNPVTIWQDIPTIVGKQYSLSFQYSPRPGVSQADNAIQPKLNNAALGAVVSADGSANGNTVWQTITRTFIGTGSPMKVELADAGSDTSLGGYLDDVKLNCVGDPAPLTSTVTMCKTDDAESPKNLSGWTLLLNGDAVQTGLVVPVNSAAGINSTTLVSGVSYIAKAVGTWLNQGGANPVDTEYSTTDAWATHMDGYTGYQSDILELQIDNKFDPNSNWGAYNSLHRYAQSFVPTGTSSNFRIFDGTGTTQNEGWFTDNSGKLSVDITKGFSGITGENGCVTITGVPYGTYTVDEIMQDGWINVSGLGTVTVNDPTETFTVVNRDTNADENQCVDEPTPLVKEFGFVCNDSGTGQTCVKDYSTDFALTEDGTVDVNYTVPGGHCSAVKIHTYIDGLPVATSNFFGWSGDPMTRPMSGALLSDYALSSGTHNISLVAEGEVGGCNGGSLYSWGGTLNIETENSCNEVPTISSHTTVVKAADLAVDISAVVVTPTKWFFYNDRTGSVDGAEGINNAIGSFINGPAIAPLGLGSVQISVPNEGIITNNARRNIATYQFKDVKLADIKNLSFSTYSHLAGDGALGLSERAPYLHFNVDFNNSDTWQRRLVYVPGQNGVVIPDTWQTWDAINSGNALWVYSGPTWPTTADAGTTPKTWSQILALYPNAETRSTDSWFGFRVGEPYPDGFTGNVDKVSIGIKSGLTIHTETFDFEPTAVVVTPQCSDGVDNGDEEDSLIDATDPACHTDKNVNNTESYTPSVNSESNSESAQCSDGISNDADGLIDSNDPGCMSGEGGSWNPSDNDEVNQVPTVTTAGGGGGGSAPLSKSVGGSSTGSVLGASTQCGLYVDSYLKMGKKNNVEQVKKLQTFLNDYMKLDPKLPVNGIFGFQTYKAVLKFQEQEAEYILKPWLGITLKSLKPTGWVYKTTVTRINNIMCPPLNLQNPPLTID